MPEGDIVWRTAQRLNTALAGRELTACDLRWPSLATVDLTGHLVIEVISAGKHLLTRLDGSPEPLTLHSHLRMEGTWHVHRTGQTWHARSDSGVRAVLSNTDWTAVGHRLGMLDLVATRHEDRLVGHLGPDLLGPSWDTGRVAAAIAAQPSRAIGEVLLDQRVLAGAGTFYMSEALFLRGLTPWTPVAQMLDRSGGTTGIVALVDLLHRLLAANRDRAVQITTGDATPGRTNWVHARSGRPCRRCGTLVRVAPVGPAPRDRTAFYCPSCQGGPAPTDDGRPQAPLGARRRTRVQRIR